MLYVEDHGELQAAVLALKAADRDLKSRINKATRATMGPVWKQQVEAAVASESPFVSLLLKGVSVSAGNPPSFRAATSTRKVGRKGSTLTPAKNFYLAEFGANANHVARYQRKSRASGGTHQVRRHTNTGLPEVRRKGRVIYPLVAKIAPRTVSLWVQLIIKTYAEAAEGK